MSSSRTADSYSAIASRYDGESNETSFWGELARQAYDNIVLVPRYRLIADVGCGTGLGLHHLVGRAAPSARFVGIEPAEQMRMLAQHRLAGCERVEVRDG